MSELPIGWEITQLGQVIELKYGKSLPARERSGAGHPVYGSNGVVGYHHTALTSGKTIIVGRKGSVGEVNFSQIPCSPIDTTYYVDQFPCKNPKYWFYKLKQLDLGILNKSTAIPGFNRADAYSLTIQLPPINEQKRIADKLDAVLTRVDACRDRLDHIPTILKRFRQSVLAAATSGKLTEDWSGHAPFSEITLGEIAKWSSGGTPSRSKPHYYGGGIPWVKTGELRENIITSTEETLTEDGLKNSSAKLFPRETVLIAMYGATIGRVALLGIEAATNQACAAAVANLGTVTPQYLVLLLQAEKANLVAKGQGGAQPNISQGLIKEHVVMLPDMAEQNEIVRRVEALFACADRLEARYTAARAQVEKLTPATLAKAFRGELVPQDPNDEPASVLLERIRALGGEQSASRPKRGRKVAA